MNVKQILQEAQQPILAKLDRIIELLEREQPAAEKVREELKELRG